MRAERAQNGRPEGLPYFSPEQTRERAALIGAAEKTCSELKNLDAITVPIVERERILDFARISILEVGP